MSSATDTAPAVRNSSEHAERRDAAVAQLDYKPALDGLRGLAVLAVLFYHQNHLVGGFLGVDVFFVLSGFLITSLLMIDHSRTGKVISLGFWGRRARRLIPALLVFLLILSLFAAVIAKPPDYEAIRGGAFATMLYGQNYWLLHHLNHGRYALSHTWSLSIEEQFYLLWPFVLALLVFVARRTKWLVAAVLALAVASAVLMAIRYTGDHEILPSYLPLETRAHELLIGGALGVLLLGRRVSGVALEVAGAIALVFLVVLTIGTHQDDPWLYEGGFVLIAVASAILIAACVSEGTSRFRAVLSWRPLVWIGLISYGLYLFHVPLYYFVYEQHVVTWEPGRVVLRLALAFAVATASFHLVERPIRRGKLSRPTLLVLTPVAAGLVVVAILASTAGARRATPIELQSAVFAQAKSAAPSGSQRVLVVGDSLASSFASSALPRFNGAGISGVVEWASHCDVIGGVAALSPDATSQRAPTCAFEDSYRGAVRGFDPDVSVVVLGPSAVFDRAVGGERLDVGTSAFDDYLSGRLDAIRAPLVGNGARFMITTVPCMTPPSTGPYAGLAAIQRDPKRIAAVNEGLRAYAEQHQVPLVDLGGLVCSHPDYLDTHGTGLSPAGELAAWNLLATRVDELRTEGS